MDGIKQYIVTFGITIIVIAFLEMFSPDGYKKYVGIVCSLVVTITMLSPMLSIKDIVLVDSSPYFDSGNTIPSGNEIINSVMLTGIETGIRNALSKEEIAAELTVIPTYGDDGKIFAVERIDIHLSDLSKKEKSIEIIQKETGLQQNMITFQ